jgi:hypothetical protein
MRALIEAAGAVIAAASLTLAWTAPLYADRTTHYEPAGCVACAVLLIPQKLGPSWWEQRTITDTLATLPATDGTAMAYLMPLWVGYGSGNVVCRDAAGNWSGPSNYVESKRP